MKSIVCEGRWDINNSKYDVNMSSIWSYLIRECGKLVENYNSDLIIDINSITKYVESSLGDTQPKNEFWIGFRESGVDGKVFITNRCDNDYYYRGIYKITVDKDDRGRCSVVLEKSSAWNFRRENKIVK